MARTFDEYLVLFFKVIVIVVLFVAVIVPVQIIWFVLFIFIKGLKKETTLWTPTEKYAKFGKRLITGQEE